MGKQATEGSVAAESQEQVLITKGARQTTVAPFLSQALEVSRETFWNGSEFVSYYQESIAPSGQRREKIYNEPENGIRWINKLGDENDARSALPGPFPMRCSVTRGQHAPAQSRNLPNRCTYRT